MFKGRYGVDRLTFAIIAVALVISIISLFFGYSAYLVRYILSGLSTVIIVLALVRTLSRNFPARQRELHKYMELEYKVVSFFRGFRRNADNRRHYKYFKCPKCRQRLRVPRGKGKLRVRCAKCSYQFELKA